MGPREDMALSTSDSRCGEIFVSNKADKWTFFCSFCQKATSDIGVFICHIRLDHLAGLLDCQSQTNNMTPEEEEENNFQESTESHHMSTSLPGEEEQEEETNIHLIKEETLSQYSYNSDELPARTSKLVEICSVTDSSETGNAFSAKYFDCTNYLDVSVHTDADDSPNNGIKTKQGNKAGRQNNTVAVDTNNQQKQRNHFFDLPEEDEGNKIKNAKNNNIQNKTELFDYDMEDDDDGVEIVNDENNEAEGVDEDNLLFLRSSSIEDTAGDNAGVGAKGGSKKYRSHVRGKAYCNLCDKTFQYYSLYRNHMIKHSNITPYKCEYCSKAFKSKQAIRYHMNTHTKEVQYTCPLCPMTYGTENQFITHVLNHESETCFPCMVCAKILKSDQDREEHLATHTEERPFGCNYCNKRFRQKHHLSNHLKLHCQYRCDFCKAEFTSTQTQRRPYACASCEEYPEVRIQVEKQRSKSSNNSEVNPLEIIYDGGGKPDAENTECVDLATDDDDDESETSTSLLGGTNGQNRVTCQYCTRAYKNSSALNYHMRQKHSHVWRDMK